MKNYPSTHRDANRISKYIGQTSDLELGAKALLKLIERYEGKQRAKADPGDTSYLRRHICLALQSFCDKCMIPQPDNGRVGVVFHFYQKYGDVLRKDEDVEDILKEIRVQMVCFLL